MWNPEIKVSLRGVISPDDPIPFRGHLQKFKDNQAIQKIKKKLLELRRSNKIRHFASKTLK